LANLIPVACVIDGQVDCVKYVLNVKDKEGGCKALVKGFPLVKGFLDIVYQAGGQVNC
jgi:hypothetical protein